MVNIQPASNNEIVPGSVGMTFNFALALPGQASSLHTARAYFRWVDQFLVDVAGWKPAPAQPRVDRMQRLPVGVLTTA